MLIDIGAELTAQLAESRADAESLMLDSCVVRRPGETTTDPGTGEPTTPMTEVYSGKAKVQTYEAQESNPEAGEAVLTFQRYQVHVPVGSFEPAVGDVVEITTAALDAHLVGHTFRVVAPLDKSMATAYRLGVERRS